MSLSGPLSAFSSGSRTESRPVASRRRSQIARMSPLIPCSSRAASTFAPPSIRAEIGMMGPTSPSPRLRRDYFEDRVWSFREGSQAMSHGWVE